MERRTPRRPPDGSVSPVERYLAAIEFHLNDLPADSRASEIAEISAHLMQMTEELRGQGLSENAAQALAVQRFGPPEAVAADLRMTYLRTESPDPGTLPQAVGVTLLWTAACSGILLLLMIAAGHLGLLDARGVWDWLPVALCLIWFLETPLVAGTMATLAAPAFALRGVTLAYGSLTLLVLALRAVVTMDVSGGPVFSVTLAVGGALWLALGVSASLLTRRWMERGPRPARAH